MEHKKILDYLYSLDSLNIKLGLQNVQRLLKNIGNPEKELKCIHVAGTNGKGSVCAMLFYILREAGYKVGLYTSPHLKKFNERIRINDKLITDKEIADYFLKIRPHVTSQSFFEITTAIAFLYFMENKADYVVLETGLGGRLDATNAVFPLVSVITNIGLEHTDLLGGTIEKIAFEKAGIIKNSVPVVTGAEGRALKVIEKIAMDKNAPLHLAKKMKFADSFFPVKFKYLRGEFQQENAKIAAAAADIFRKIYSPETRLSQIKNGIKKARWAGRLQFISKNVLVDCAHNPAGFIALKKELVMIKNKKKIPEFFFVIGIQQNKDIANMLKIMNPLISKVIFTKSGNEKAAEPKELLDAFKKINSKRNFFAKLAVNPKKALGYAVKIAGKDDLVVAAGSIYMVGEII